jgi:23S rRNA (pseudouridine1915-N3)-methyltransferase
MKVVLLAVGRLKEAYWIAAEEEYRKRLRPYCHLTINECRDEAALITAVPKGAHLVALDERGPSMSSVEFASDLLAAAQMHGAGAPLAFAIGGADGHSDLLRQRARQLLSFGKMTIAHRLVRLLLLEQIYRGFRIVRNEPYHRD